MSDAKELPVLKPVEPVAMCGFCSNAIYPDGCCQSAGPQPQSCPLHGDEWRQIRILRDMQNTIVR